MKVERVQIVAAINGPGEVAAWLYPFADILRRHHPHVSLRVALMPCVFASGRETLVVDDMPGIDAVCTPDETMRWITRGTVPDGFNGIAPAGVVHFGGELLLSVALARRMGRPIVVYEEDRVRWPWLLNKICVVDDRVGGAKEANGKVREVGNLMVDAAQLRVPHRRPAHNHQRTVALFPGSRSYFVQQMLPFLLMVASRVQREIPGTRWVLAKSDFVALDDIGRFTATREGRVLEGHNASWERESSRDVLVSEDGVRVNVVSPAEAMRVADLALTIPGTSTAELAALGIPMILALPAYHLHTLPLPGLAGHLGGIPVLGPAIKKMVARSYLRSRRHWAHPNRRSDERIVPELVGSISATLVADEVVRQLHLPTEPIAERLRDVMGAPGAARRFADEVMATLSA